MISERQQQFVADLFEPSGAVGADDHAVEAIAQVERDGDQRVDLLVGRRRLPWRPEDADRPRAGSHLLPAPRARSAAPARWRRIALKAAAKAPRQAHRPPSSSSREMSIPFSASTSSIAALRIKPFTSPPSAGIPVCGLHPLDLPPQLPAPFPLSLPGPPKRAGANCASRARSALESAHMMVEPLPVGALRLARMLGGGGRARGADPSARRQPTTAKARPAPAVRRRRPARPRPDRHRPPAQRPAPPRRRRQFRRPASGRAAPGPALPSVAFPGC